MGPSTTDTHSLSTRTVTEHPPTEGLGSYAETVRARERPDPGRSLPRTSGPRASAALGTGLSSFKSGWETVSSPQGEDRRPSTDAGRRLAWVPEPLTLARGGADWPPKLGKGFCHSNLNDRGGRGVLFSEREMEVLPAEGGTEAAPTSTPAFAGRLARTPQPPRRAEPDGRRGGKQHDLA